MDADRWLTDVFEPQLTEDVLDSSRRIQLIAAIEALEDCGVLSRDQALGARRRLAEVRAWAAERAVSRDEPLAARPAPANPGDLLQVIPAVRALATIGGIELMLTSVELWSRQVRLAAVANLNIDEQAWAATVAAERVTRLARMSGSASRPVPPPSEPVLVLSEHPSWWIGRLPITLRDDVGTTYQDLRSDRVRSHSSNDATLRRQECFEPAPPPEARRLVIEIADLDARPLTEVTVELPTQV